MNELKNLTPFRFWVQQVLPEVYDDSLSYSELLNKVVAKLNEVIEQQNAVKENFETLEGNFETLQDNFNTLNENFGNIFEAFVNLGDYVQDYFDNLDVQEEINNKLDEMALNGTLTEIVNAVLTNAGNINTIIAPIITDWLEANLTDPTTPAVDRSLSVDGAAADSKTVGVTCLKAFGAVITGDYINSLHLGRAFTIMDLVPGYSYAVAASAVISGIPTELTGVDFSLAIIKAIKSESVFNYAMYIAFNNNCIYYAMRGGGTTLGWRKIARSTDIDTLTTAITTLSNNSLKSFGLLSNTETATYDTITKLPLNYIYAIPNDVNIGNRPPAFNSKSFSLICARAFTYDTVRNYAVYLALSGTEMYFALGGGAAGTILNWHRIFSNNYSPTFDMRNRGNGKIVLLGDSIVAGVGSSDYNQNGSLIVTIPDKRLTEGYLVGSDFYRTRTGTEGNYTYSNKITGAALNSDNLYYDLIEEKYYLYESSAFVYVVDPYDPNVITQKTYYRSTGTNSWAAKFKTYIEQYYPSCTVTNNGLAGKGIEEIAHYLDYLIPDNTNYAIVCCGINDRGMSPSSIIGGFYEKLITRIQTKGITPILLSPITVNGATFATTPGKINTVLENQCINNDIIYANLFSEFNNVIMSGTQSDFYADTLHPNDNGYRHMFGLICKLLDY